MRAVIQRVSEARAVVGADIAGQVGQGLCVLLGISKEDTETNADHLAHKIKGLRIFEDERGKMNRSVTDIRGGILVVSQFTLYGDCTKGNRPSFSDAAPAAEAERLYEIFVARLKALGLPVATGRFQAKMAVSLTNDGPVTFILEA